MLKQVIDVYELLDDPHASGEKTARFLQDRGLSDISWKKIQGEKGSTDFMQIRIPGRMGKQSGGKAPTLGLVGRLGGIGARPERIGLVSDADGAITVLAAALKLGDMAVRGDVLPGDVVITTHICPNAPTQPHEPVPFMGSPVDMETMNLHEVAPEMDAILSVDTTKGNRVINRRGFAISPTVKSGYILKASEDLLNIMEWSTGLAPVVFPLSQGDITPYGNGVYHLNSILQPATAGDIPVVGVAITTVSPVPGCGTGASRETDIEEAARFCLEVAKSFGAGACRFYDEAEFALLEKLYGSMKRFQTPGNQP
jgi:hypothetical protein